MAAPDAEHQHPDADDQASPSPRTVADAIFTRDPASNGLGMEIVEVADGRAVMTMTVRPDMVNGLDVCHGGLIFTLADSAMAFSSNCGNEKALAVNAEIDWVSPGRVGDVLTATAEQQHRRGRNAITDVTVTDQTGRTVALFRGRVRFVEGTHL